jgi:Nucleotidyltransferase
MHGRSKKSTATVRVGGVTTQRLRHIDLLLHAPWFVKIDDSNGFPLAHPTTVRVPSAIAYIAQKILVRQKRAAEGRAKDLLYIRDTIELFGRSLPMLHKDWTNTFRQQLHAKAVRTIERAGSVIFGQVDDISREAALMATGRSLSADEILEVCRSGWKQIFE